MSARILVVDDVVPNVKLLEAKLTSEYYDVITAANGEEALEKAKNERPDILLLDVMMPGMDGFEVCRQIKNTPDMAHIPVVMVTALTDTQDKVRGLEAGADDFLSKPIDDTALMARVRSLLRLKMALDEWRVRENTANQFGVVEGQQNVMELSVENAQILVVEDKDYEQSKLHDALSIDGNNILTVSNGLEAIEMIQKHQFDMIVVSLDLEHEDGLRLCSHFRSNENSRSVPVLMVSNEEGMDRVVRGLEIGGHDYILRPIDKNELLARTRTQVRRKRFQERLRSTYEISLSMALTDSLTGLHNRRYLEVHIDKLLEKNKAAGKALSVLILDIDHFKSVNDTHGHGVGDEILKQFAQRLKDNVRSFDLVARLGGEEFVVILPEVTDGRAYMVSERLRRCIAERPFEAEISGGKLDVTTSIGAVFIDKEILPPKEILERADKALYQAKDGGRNQVVFEAKGKLDPKDYREKSRPFT
ncbi:MAG: PleD family two-component system response regulator [Pseudomonadota bacterium]